jgi:flagellar biosynthesis/type III secretory pathway M-ring protein FliF/YscJ
MHTYLRRTLIVLLGACPLTLLSEHADAFVDMPNRERVQAISWTVEGVTAIVIMLVFWAIWRKGKRSQSNKRSKQEDSTR